MEKIIVEIGASKDSYGAYAVNCDGIYGQADTIEGVQADILEAIRLTKENLPQEQWPDQIKNEYEIEWRYDVQSLLKHYQGIFTNAALERLTGINQKQLWNYANGVSKPRLKARLKIQNALNRLGRELAAITL